MYQNAVEADAYDRQRNTTITKYRKLLYRMDGTVVPDNFSANHKMASNFFNRFVTQQVQYQLGNGVYFEKDDTKARLGKDFDTRMQEAARAALVGGCSYLFFNLDRVNVFKATEFVPLYDEENGAMMAGIRWWQVAADKPLRATLYEIDGYTEYIKGSKDATLKEMRPKRAYKLKIRSSVVDGTEIYAGENYPTFPIIVLWGNPQRQSELIGIREEIDCYDLIRSGFANDLDDASQIYWTLENAGGMDDIDLAKFIERMKTVHAATIDGDSGSKAEAHTLEVPYQSREAYLTRLEKDLYKDFMAVDVMQIAAGSVTATQIVAAYEPLNNKCDQFEYLLIDAIDKILECAGIVDNCTFKRSKIVNQLEETQMVLSAGQFLDDETIIKHLPFLSPDEVDGILTRNAEEAMAMIKAQEMAAAQSSAKTENDENNGGSAAQEGSNGEEGEE